MTTRSIVPPPNGYGGMYPGDTAEALSRPTQRPSPVRAKVPGWVMISALPTGSVSMKSVSVPRALPVASSSPVDLGHAGEQALLVVGERAPGTNEVELRPRLPLRPRDPCRLSVRIERR